MHLSVDRSEQNDRKGILDLSILPSLLYHRRNFVFKLGIPHMLRVPTILKINDTVMNIMLDSRILVTMNSLIILVTDLELSIYNKVNNIGNSASLNLNIRPS